jgi:hypothetical protein
LKELLAFRIPDIWRIKRREETFVPRYVDASILPILGASSEETYQLGLPRTGWIAFELYSGNVEFPNAFFTPLVRDSPGGGHRIERQPMAYVKTGEIVTAS